MIAGGSIRKWLVLTLVIMLFILLTQPSISFARKEGGYELISGDVSFGNVLGQRTDTQDLFHQQTLNTVDDEALNINFPLNANDLGLGPTALNGNVTSDGLTAGGTAAANVLPFGPVDLAFPDISQTVNQLYGASSTGYYYTNFLSIPPDNSGAGPVLGGPFTPISLVSPPQSIAGPLMPFPQMVDTAPISAYNKALGATSNSGTNSTNASKSIPINTVQ